MSTFTWCRPPDGICRYRKLQAGQVLSHAADESTLSRYWQPNFRESNIHQATDPGQALYVLLKMP